MNLSLKIQTACLFLATITLSSQVNAGTCAKCTKIEAERAKEQAKPDYQKNEYYDDHIKKSKSDNPTPNATQQIDENEIKDNQIDKESPLSLLKSHESLTWIAVLDTDEVTTPDTKKFGQDFLNSNNSSINKEKEENLNKKNPQNNVNIASYSPQADSIVADILSIRSFMDVFKHHFTILAPSDEAIKHFPSIALNKILEPENRELLFGYITNHIIPHQILRQDFDKPYKTLGGRNIEFQSNENGITLNGDAKVVKSLPLGDKGILYVIDKVLIPIHD